MDVKRLTFSFLYLPTVYIADSWLRQRSDKLPTSQILPCTGAIAKPYQGHNVRVTKRKRKETSPI